MTNLPSFLKSRKFWAAIAALVFILLKYFQPNFPIDEAGLTNIVLTLAAYILGTALEDGLRGHGLQDPILRR